MRTWTVPLVVLGIIVAAACGGGDIYDACSSNSDCNAPNGKTPVCINASTQGFCSWACSQDGDCKGDDSVTRICSSYESTGGMYCFPSCENGLTCPDGFSCRNTGGGVQNRKICYPG